MDAREFSVEMSKLPPPPEGSNPPHWTYWRGDLYHRALTENPNGFYGWPCVYHTMIVNHWKEYMQLEHDELPMRYRMNATLVNVPFYPLDLMNGSDMSFNFVHQLYHIYRFAQATGVNIADMHTIVEFGGGYGAMRLMAHRLGFRGTYYIYDLPEFLLLQRFFLSNFDSGETVFCNEVYQIPPENADLLIACYSLSESDLELREKFLGWTPYDNFLFLSSDKFAEYDNEDYFMGTINETRGLYKWHLQPIKHLPPASFYLFGSRK